MGRTKATAPVIQPRQPQRTEYVITDEGIPEDHLIFEGVDVTEGPHFTISEVAKFFFGRSPHWIRWRERGGKFVFDGEQVGTQRTPKGARLYDLADVEKMAHALAEGDHIDATQLSNILKLVLIEATIWGYLTGPAPRLKAAPDEPEPEAEADEEPLVEVAAE